MRCWCVCVCVVSVSRRGAGQNAIRAVERFVGGGVRRLAPFDKSATEEVQKCLEVSRKTLDMLGNPVDELRGLVGSFGAALRVLQQQQGDSAPSAAAAAPSAAAAGGSGSAATSVSSPAPAKPSMPARPPSAASASGAPGVSVSTPASPSTPLPAVASTSAAASPAPVGPRSSSITFVRGNEESAVVCQQLARDSPVALDGFGADMSYTCVCTLRLPPSLLALTLLNHSPAVVCALWCWRTPPATRLCLTC